MADQGQVRKFLRIHLAPGAADRLRPLDGLRGLAALLVFFVHFDSLFRSYFQSNSFVGALLEIGGSFGHVGVDIFFVLSGFLIYGILMKRSNFYAFIWRRIRRLYPVYLFVLGLYVMLSLAFPSHSKLPGSSKELLLCLGANILMLPGMTTIPAIITVSWSMSYEWFFYLIMPAAVASLRLRYWLAWWRVGLFFFLAFVECVLWSVGVFGHVRFILFFAGIILWELVNQGMPRFLSGRTEYLAAVTFILSILAIGISGAKQAPVLVLSRVPHFYAPLLFFAVPVFGMYAMFFDGFLKKLFSWDYLVWMGNISYSYYLIHGVTLHGLQLIVNRFFAPTPRSALFCGFLLILCLSITIFCGALLFVLVEKPLSWPKNRGGATSKPNSEFRCQQKTDLQTRIQPAMDASTNISPRDICDDFSTSEMRSMCHLSP